MRAAARAPGEKSRLLDRRSGHFEAARGRVRTTEQAQKDECRYSARRHALPVRPGSNARKRLDLRRAFVRGPVLRKEDRK